MRVLVCGGRNYGVEPLDPDEWDRWRALMQRSFAQCSLGFLMERRGISQIIEGGAKGADTEAREFAEVNNIRLTTVMADWEKYGRKAGSIRNQRMLDACEPEAVVAFPGGVGTADMMDRARKAGLKVWEPVIQPTFHQTEDGDEVRLKANGLIYATIKPVGGTKGSYGVFLMFSPKRYNNKTMDEIKGACPDDVTVHGQEKAIEIAKGMLDYVVGPHRKSR